MKSMLVFGIVVLVLFGIVFTQAYIAQKKSPMSAEELEANMRRVIAEAYNKSNLKILDELYAPDIVLYRSPYPDIEGLEGCKEWILTIHRVYPDCQFMIDEIIVNGDTVVARWTFQGTHKGQSREIIPIPPTGKQVIVKGCTVGHWVDGKVVKQWDYMDWLGQALQVGLKLVPPPIPITKENKAIVLRAVEQFWNRKKLDIIDEIYAPNLVNHEPGVPDIRSVEEFKHWVSAVFTAIPDIHITIEDLVAEGDKVIKRWTACGTHKGEFMGVPPTGKQITKTGISIYRITEGKIVEIWSNSDDLGILQQLGVIPPPK